jgi:flagella basal body P-ring formation protein FlgA
VKYKFDTLVFLVVVLANVSNVHAAPWVFTMADSVSISKSDIRLSDLCHNELPATVAQLVVGHTGAPGSTTSVSRKSVLRQLVTAGKAGGVSFKGAINCEVVRTGKSLNPHSLRPEIRKVLQPHIPVARNGAPATWFELILPEKIGMAEDGDFEIRIDGISALDPGRNHLSVNIAGAHGDLNFPITVVLHQFDEVAKAKMQIKRGDSLIPEQFQWSWTDLGLEGRKTDFYGREALLGVSCSRTIHAGDYLRQNDLKPTPVILSGDLVELQLQRGSVTVSVNATARQEGSIGQVIPVRNEITKRLVNARVVGPGMVKWRN